LQAAFYPRFTLSNDAGDRAFFEAEIQRLLGRLYGVALRLTGNQADAEDLVSETTIKAWSKLGQLEDRQSFPKWVFRILTNTFISNRRGAHLEHTTPLEQDGEQPFSLFEKLHQPFLLWWSNPEQELLNKLLREDIEHALDNLPESFRTIVVLVDIEGYGYGEVAENLGVPIGTVRSRLSRARSMLQRSLWEQARTAGLTGGPPAKEVSHD
jgi:RNA polymerase sigma-70 factor (ECF subfamily)